MTNKSEKVLSDLDMANDENEAFHVMARVFEAWSMFPTAQNFNAMANAMTNYQTAWMNGRIRPTLKEKTNAN